MGRRKRTGSNGVVIFERDGKYYWTMKSKAFDGPKEAYKDVVSTIATTHLPDISQKLHTL